MRDSQNLAFFLCCVINYMFTQRNARRRKINHVIAVRFAICLFKQQPNKNIILFF